MGISIDVGNTGSDYSYLFQGLSGGSLGNLNFHQERQLWQADEGLLRDGPEYQYRQGILRQWQNKQCPGQDSGREDASEGLQGGAEGQQESDSRAFQPRLLCGHLAEQQYLYGFYRRQERGG